MHKIDVLDKGFVALVDHMGSDLTVVNAARVSFRKRSDWDVDCDCRGVVANCMCPRRLSEKDSKLIQFLADHRHDTPFCHPQVQLHMKMPIFVARQWMRSGVGIRISEPADGCLEVDMAFNETSRRYVQDEPEFYEPQQWRGKPIKGAKQGSHGVVAWQCPLAADTHAIARAEYESRLAAGIAPEMARMCLPQSLYTEFWVTMSLMAASRVYLLRCDEHAQREVQEYANALMKIVAPLFPVSWKALTENKTWAKE